MTVTEWLGTRVEHDRDYVGGLLSRVHVMLQYYAGSCCLSSQNQRVAQHGTSSGEFFPLGNMQADSFRVFIDLYLGTQKTNLLNKMQTNIIHY